MPNLQVYRERIFPKAPSEHWQNQQMVYLDKWESEGLVNKCVVEEINYIKPIMFSNGYIRACGANLLTKVVFCGELYG